MAEDLSSTPPWELENFINDHILGDTRFLTKLRADIDIIGAFLQESCFQGAVHPVRVSRVMMSGSFDSDSDLKDTGEVNITVFLKNIRHFDEVFEYSEDILKEIKEQLCKLPGEKEFQLCYEVQNSEDPNPSYLTFKLSCPELQKEVECRVWLARDVLDELRKKQVFDIKIYNKIYTQLIDECTTQEKEGDFYLCFTELHQEFLRNHPCKLRNLICLVKHWHQLCKEKLGDQLPSRNALELLTVYAWECGNEDFDYDIAQGFRTVLELVIKYKQLLIYWTVYYNFEHQEISKYLHRQLSRTRPIILDPADPTRNEAGGTNMGWNNLADVAQKWLEYPCFENRDGSRVSCWDLQWTHKNFNRLRFWQTRDPEKRGSHPRPK